MRKPDNYPRYQPEDDAGSVWGGRRCIAWSKQAGRRCRRAARRGLDVCSIHGGKSLRGYASPRMKHGFYSRDILARLRAAATAYIDDLHGLHGDVGDS